MYHILIIKSLLKHKGKESIRTVCQCPLIFCTYSHPERQTGKWSIKVFLCQNLFFIYIKCTPKQKWLANNTLWPAKLWNTVSVGQC